MMVKEAVVVLFAAVMVVEVAVSLGGGKEQHNEAEKMLNGCDKAIFLLAGQSNMAGRGGIKYNHGPSWDGRTPPLCQPDPRIDRLNDPRASSPEHLASLWRGARDALCQHSPDHPSGHRDCRVGPMRGRQHIDLPVEARRLLASVRASLRDGGSLRGMLWYQGENDCHPELADKYEDRLKAFFNDIRNDLMLPSLPIIQVALDSAKVEVPSVKKIRSVQLNLKLPNLKTVDAQGLPLNSDDLHLTTDSQVKLGSKLAQEFIKYSILYN